jgi:hypothetical protein
VSKVNITKIVVLELAPPICPQQHPDLTIIANFNNIREVRVFGSHLREYIHSLADFTIFLPPAELTVKVPEDSLCERNIFISPEQAPYDDVYLAEINNVIP